MAHVLSLEIQALAKEFGIERLGFFTLTFADHVTRITEAQRRFNSLNTHVLKARYCRAIGVWERQKSGRIHFHLVVVLASDIRTGVDFEAFDRGDYRSAGQALRSEWAFWRKTAPKYRFGRTELLPVKSTAQGIARYVGKYVSKHIGQREQSDKGARVVRFIGFKPGQRTAGAQFAWATENGWLWRHKVAAFARSVGAADLAELRKLFGPRWAYHLQGAILAMPVEECFPSYSCAMRSHALTWNRFDQALQAHREREVAGQVGKVYELVDRSRAAWQEGKPRQDQAPGAQVAESERPARSQPRRRLSTLMLNLVVGSR